MLDVKQAALKAFEYFATLYPGCDTSKTLLEEVELTEDGEILAHYTQLSFRRTC
jgi:hypothetical protein